MVLRGLAQARPPTRRNRCENATSEDRASEREGYLKSKNATIAANFTPTADNVGYKDYWYDLTSQDFIKQVQPSLLSGVTLDGKVTGYPFSVQAYSFIYNKKVFRDAGITTFPQTIADYDALAKKLQAKGIQPFATGFKEWWVLPQTAWGVIAPSIQDVYGGYAAFVDKLTKGTLKFSAVKEMSSVFDLLDLIKKYGGPKPLESDFNDQVAMIATGKAGIIHQGDWAESQIQKIASDAELGQLLTPVAAGASKAGIMMDSNITLRVAKDGKNVPAALAFLRRQAPHAGSPRPDLILLDLNLPKKDGREVLAEIKEDEDLKRIYARGYFERVSYSLSDDPAVGRVLTADVAEKSWGPNYLRVGLDLGTGP